METELSGNSVSDEEEPQDFSFGKYLDSVCPHYMSYGMTWDEFWYSSTDRLQAYWQKHQFEIEWRNNEMWLQGLYIRSAVASCLDSKNKYPEKPHRITQMTQEEKDAENRQVVRKMREQLIAIKARWDAKHKGDETA